MNERENRRSRNVQGEVQTLGIDVTMLFCVFLLNIIGLLMIYSVTAYKSGAKDFFAQLICILAGTGLMVLVTKVGIKWIPPKTLAFIALAVAGVSVLFLLIPGLKVTLNGATSWFKFPGLPFTIQSAEIVKIAAILIMAWLLSIPNILANKKGIAVAFSVPLVMGLILGGISNNMSSAIIVVGISYIMIFVKSRRYAAYGVLAIGVAVLVLIMVILIKSGIGDGFRMGRIRVWLNPEDTSTDVDNYQTIQSLYAIGSGGLWGKGIGESIQKMNKIPEAENDMIFAVLCEELGFVGAMVVIILFAALILRLVNLATKCNSMYDTLIVSGVAGHIALQAILNIAVVTNTIPNTGVSLPFISSGGSSVLCLLFEIALVLCVTKNQKVQQ
ncbi:MAG: FtsW/RodA/SpoVE family cell cycle protein [Lachnospiraceae bacterium]|nr:FtsW/RodA/SpoVE family cell cycle protein [Lachnospiraceae bacterium]